MTSNQMNELKNLMKNSKSNKEMLYYASKVLAINNDNLDALCSKFYAERRIELNIETKYDHVITECSLYDIEYSISHFKQFFDNTLKN